LVEENVQLEESLPFSKPKQEALLGYTLIDDKFFNQIKLKVKKEWFVDPRCSQVYGALVAESATAKRKLKPEELKECRTFMLTDMKERERLSDAINMAMARTSDYGLDALTPELTDWLQARIYIESVYKSRDLFNTSRSAPDSTTSQLRRTEAYRLLREMGKQIEDTSFEGNEEVSFENIQQDLVTQENEYKNAMTFGIKTVDQLLLPEAQGNGSLLPGDMTILLGPQNAGKSSAMLTIVAANLKAGKNVLLIPHEGRVNDLKLKLIQCISGLTKKQLFQYGQDPRFRDQFAVIESLLRDHLVYIPMIKAGLDVEEVGNTVRRARDRFAAKHNGAKIDLLADDYLARLTSLQNGRGQFQKRERDQVVYEYGASLAGECELHLLTAIQVNRTGNEINRKMKGSEDRLLVPEDVSESYGTMMVATNIVSLNRSPMAQVKNRLTYLICKSRSSEVNLAVACKTNYPCCITHSNELGSTWYRGLSAMDERIDELMSQYKDGAIPEVLVLKPD